MRGSLFETWVVSEAVKRIGHRALAVQLHYWRDRAGNEVDLLAERSGRSIPLECKAGATVAADWYEALGRYLSLAGAPGGILVFGGEGRFRRGRIATFGWRHIEPALDALLGTGAGL
jgi:hypothetical protein